MDRSECQPQENHAQEPPPVVQPLSVDPALLADLVCETALATGTPDDALSATSQYPQFMSVDGRSGSSTSQVSPNTDSLDTSFPPSDALPFDRADANPSMSHDWALPTESLQTSSRISIGTLPTRTTNRPVSTQGTVSNQTQGIQSKLSNAPQTKSEQQRQRLDLENLEKLSNAKLQELVRRLAGAQEHDGGNAGSGSETHQPSREVRHFAQQKSRTPRSPPRRGHQGSASQMQQCSYEDCGFSGRICDLNKHVKRHQKPYGCTYPKCYKRFGAKSDWKRHENSQHFQQEAFRCDYLDNRGERCGQHFFRQIQFQNHLPEHKITSKDMQSKLESCRIGKNCQGSYWCGFCCGIKPLKHKRNDAWDERFDHIAHHFEKDTPKKNIDDWICVEENATKRQLQENLLMDKEDNYADAEDREDKAPIAEEVARSISGSAQDNARKRPATANTPDLCPPTKRKKTVTTVVYCVSVNKKVSQNRANVQ